MRFPYATLGTIYTVGIMFTVSLAIFAYARLLANKFSLRNLLLLPIYLLVGLCGGLIFPWLLIKDSSFREALIETGRIAILFGYFASAIFTMRYPWIWAWYISGCLAWYLLMRYHEKNSPKITTSLV